MSQTHAKPFCICGETDELCVSKFCSLPKGDLRPALPQIDVGADLDPYSEAALPGIEPGEDVSGGEVEELPAEHFEE